MNIWRQIHAIDPNVQALSSKLSCRKLVRIGLDVNLYKPIYAQQPSRCIIFNPLILYYKIFWWQLNKIHELKSCRLQLLGWFGELARCWRSQWEQREITKKKKKQPGRNMAIHPHHFSWKFNRLKWWLDSGPSELIMDNDTLALMMKFKLTLILIVRNHAEAQHRPCKEAILIC